MHTYHFKTKRNLPFAQSASVLCDQHWRTQDLKKGGVVVEGDHPKGEGAGGGCAPLPREARKLLKTLIRCAKMHEKITSFQLAEHARYF